MDNCTCCQGKIMRVHMSFQLKFTFILTLLLGYESINAQNQNCSNISDSSKCFLVKEYIGGKILLEKKWESSIITETGQVPLLADICYITIKI